MPGPDGKVAVLEVSAADDHDKNTHLCNAEYRLLITLAAAGAPIVVDVLTTDADWGRRLFLRLDGVSPDGRRVFGILSERGQYPSATLFNDDTADGKVQLIDLRKQFAHIVAAKYDTTFEVIGTIGTGAIVLELSSRTECCACAGCFQPAMACSASRKACLL
jgi:hypothetical protein